MAVTDATFDNATWRRLKDGYTDDDGAEHALDYRAADAYVREHRNNHPDRSVVKVALTAYMSELQGRFPNFRFTAIEGHDDEPNGTSHFHVRFFPVGEGYKNGMQQQCGLNKAFERMGFEGGKGMHPITQWQNAVKRDLEEIVQKSCGYDRAYGDGRKERMEQDTYAPSQDLGEMRIELEQVQVDAYRKSAAVRKREQRVARRESVVDEREASIAKREASIVKSEAAIADREDALAKREKDVESAVADLEPKRRCLAVQKSKLDTREVSLSRHESALADDEQEAAKQRRTLAQRRKCLDEREAEIMRREHDVDNRETNAHAHELDILKRENEIANRERAVASREHAATDRENRQLAETRRRLADITDISASHYGYGLR
ncbi:hypothetical protein HMPREF3170_09255 [Corynebacterium sp. HMSC08D02]|nr:hypothetical protein HMPREF3170_09255 [Corynebacterium sp. HMSC08D02]